MNSMRTTYWLAIQFSRVYLYMRRVQQAFHWAQHYVNTEVNMSKLLLQLLPPARLTTSLLLIKPAAELWGTFFSVLLWWARHVLRFDITTWGNFLMYSCSYSFLNVAVCVCVYFSLGVLLRVCFVYIFLLVHQESEKDFAMLLLWRERYCKYYFYCWKQWRLSFVYDRSGPHVDRHSGW